MRLFRSMLPDARDGLPVAGDQKFTLGVRVPADIEPATDGTVGPATVGMSVIAENPFAMKAWLRPRGDRFEGSCRHGVVMFETFDTTFTPPLRLRADGPPHYVVEPGDTIHLSSFQAALAATRRSWRGV